jgi:hypothetical protein
VDIVTVRAFEAAGGAVWNKLGSAFARSEFAALNRESL